MPSNKDLIVECNELSKELGVEIETEDLTNKELSSLAKDLRAKLSDKETQTQLDEPKETETETETGTATEPRYFIAKGKSVTTPGGKGILTEGDQVTEKDFRDGATTLDRLIKAKFVVKE